MAYGFKPALTLTLRALKAEGSQEISGLAYVAEPDRKLELGIRLAPVIIHSQVQDKIKALIMVDG